MAVLELWLSHQPKTIVILILSSTFSLHPKAFCPLLSILLIFCILMREYLAFRQTAAHTPSSHTVTYSSAFTSFLFALCYCLQTPLLFIFLFPILLISFSHVLSSPSLSFSHPLSLSLWQPLLNREQQTVKTGNRQCVAGLFVCVSSGMSAETGQYNQLNETL